MPQAGRMDHAARLDADHPVVLVHHVEEFGLRVLRGGGFHGAEDVGQGDPLAQAQFLAAHRFRHAESAA